MATFKEPKRTTLTSHVLKQIKQAILSSRLRPGDRIVESELAREMKISRVPIREALRYLEKEGLVVRSPFRGTYVSRLDDKNLEELYTLRSALEELAIRIVINEITDAKIAKLDSIFEAMESASREERVENLIDEDLRFHRTICEMSNHQKLLEVWLTLEHQLRSFIALASLYDEPDRFLRNHSPILEAIKHGDSEAAEKAIRHHLSEALSLLKNQPTQAYHADKT